VRIRPAVPSDIPALLAIEVAADALFAEIGMDGVAVAGPPDRGDGLDRHISAGHAWVAVGTDGLPVAYLVLDVVDGCGHVAQVSVHPAHARQGIGRSLIDHAAAWATAHDLRALTLTTFADVPWNAPYYRRLGFLELPDETVGPGLRAVIDLEAAQGLARWSRVAMVRPLDRTPGS
jgi:GNAT superfamily N-acetyltransferase